MNGAVGGIVEEPDAFGFGIDRACERVVFSKIGGDVLGDRNGKGRAEARKGALGGWETLILASSFVTAGFFEQLTGAVESALHDAGRMQDEVLRRYSITDIMRNLRMKRYGGKRKQEAKDKLTITCEALPTSDMVIRRCLLDSGQTIDVTEGVGCQARLSTGQFLPRRNDKGGWRTKEKGGAEVLPTGTLLGQTRISDDPCMHVFK